MNFSFKNLANSFLVDFGGKAAGYDDSIADCLPSERGDRKQKKVQKASEIAAGHESFHGFKHAVEVKKMSKLTVQESLIVVSIYFPIQNRPKTTSKILSV